MSQHCPRKGRVSLPEHCYHLIACTRNRTPVFSSFQHARLVVQEMKRLQHDQMLTSITWVLMPDHLHWLVQLHGSCTLAQAMKLLKGRSTSALRQHAGFCRGVWQSGFYDHAMRKEEDLAAVSRYIVANPLRAGLVKRIGDYPFWDSIYLR